MSFIWARPSMKSSAYITFFLAAADGFNSVILGFRLLVFSLFQSFLEIKIFENYCINQLIEVTRLGVIPIPIGHLLLIGITHWVGILKPLDQKRIVTKGRVKAFLLGCWLLPMAFVLICSSVIFGTSFRSHGCRNNSFMKEIPWRFAYSSFYLCSFMAILFIYAQIFMTANKLGKRNPNTVVLENEFNYKALMTTGIIIGSFGVGLVPLALVFMLSYDGGPLYEKLIGKVAAVLIEIIVNFLVILKSFLNPWIYSLGQMDVKIALKSLKMAIRTWIFGPIRLDEIERTSLYALEHGR
ncbi:unnamed protein product [Allacma fusca]|uniref:G-protein coupled receptors family 1 profile domain-containing protein n=1 Tax=Allacma fusca TaxID=39272 RepID=A0A8J2NZN8_9HEXA|nr:unnamed protein product [Allacma fusca]